MILGKTLSKLVRPFIQSISASPSIQVLKTVQLNFIRHPTSYVPFDTARVSYPPKTPLIGSQITSRTFSTSTEHSKVKSEISKSLMTEESLTDQNPETLIGNLKFLHLPEDTLKKFIPKMIDSTKDRKNLELIVKELPILGIQDQGFIETIAIAISNKDPLALRGNLKLLNLTESVLKEVIPKILAQSKTNAYPEELSGLLKELSTLDIQEESFIEAIAIFAAKYDTESLIEHLDHLNLRADVLASIISEIISKKPNKPKDTYRCLSQKIDLLIKLEALPLSEAMKNDFSEKIIFILLKNDPYFSLNLIGHLKSFNSSKENLELIISHITKALLDITKHPFVLQRSCEKILEELPTLDLNETFIEKTLLTIYRECPFQKLTKPSQFIDKWNLITKTSLPESTSLTESKEIIIKFFQRTEIKEALSQSPNTPFKNSLFDALIALDRNENITYLQKPDIIVKIFTIEIDTSPSLEKLTNLLEITKNLLIYSQKNHIELSLESIYNQTLENYNYITGKAVVKDSKITISNSPTLLIEDLKISTEPHNNDYYLSKEEILSESSNYMKHPPSIENKEITIHPFYPIRDPSPLLIDLSFCDLEAMNLSQEKAERLIMHLVSLVSQPIELLKSLKEVEKAFAPEIRKKDISFTELDEPNFIIPMFGFFILGPPKEDFTSKIEEQMIDSILLKMERKFGLNKKGSPIFVGFVDSNQADRFIMEGNTFKEDGRVSRMLLHGVNTHRLTILAFIESLKGTEFEDLDPKDLLKLVIKAKISDNSVWSELLDTTGNMNIDKNPNNFDYNCNSPFVLNSLILCFGDKLGLPNLTHCMRESFWKSTYEMVETIRQDSSQSSISKESIYLTIVKELATRGEINIISQNFSFTLSQQTAVEDPKYKDHPNNIPGIKLESPELKEKKHMEGPFISAY